MPNPLRKSGYYSSFTGGSKNSSSSSSSLENSKNEDNQEKKKKKKISLSAAKYRALLLQGVKEDKKQKSDKKKKKPIDGLEVVGNDLDSSGGVSQIEGEIRAKKTASLELEVDVEKVDAKVCGAGGGGISDECCKDVQPRDAVLMAEKGSDDNLCVICKLGGTLLGCNVKGCKKKYHLKCHDPPLKDVPPGDWHCSSCVKKNTGSSVLFSPEAVKTKLDAVKVKLADPEVVDTTKNKTSNNDGSSDSVQMLKVKAKVCGKGGVSKECCKEVQPRKRDAVLVAVRGRDDNVCVLCKLGGSTTLLVCNSKGCKKKYHLKCLDPLLKDVPPGDWHCFSCVKKNVQSGVLLLPGSVESNVDAIEVELADSEGVDGTKNNLCHKNDSSDRVEKPKEMLAHVVPSDSKFIECWVPARLSKVQLEQYCHILFSNSALLRSSSKKEILRALRDVLSSVRKCCDHPYFVEPSLQEILTDGLSKDEYLNVGVKASGKLRVLDKILSESKKRRLRVLIIFQSNVGSSGISLGDVLDDVVRQRCGVHSYERVDRRLGDEQFTKTKQAAMNRFNDKEKGRNVFLLDRRSCLPSIKLSSVDMVILYDSDLNPCNDLKLLQKITINSQHDKLKVLRLYSRHTLEEMVLVHPKQDVTVDVQNLNHSTIHPLLRWGASYLFNKLTEFHDSLCSVNQTSETCSTDTSLPGMQATDEDPHHVFWTKLLNRKTPKWRYLPAASSSLRIRKRVQYCDHPLQEIGLDKDDVTKKRRKVLSSTIDGGAVKPVVAEKGEVGGVNKEGASGTQAGVNNSASVSASHPDLLLHTSTLFGHCTQSEPLRPEPTVSNQVEPVNNTASVSVSHPELQLQNSMLFGHTTSQQAKHPIQPTATDEQAMLPSQNFATPLEMLADLSLSLGGSSTCVSTSRSRGGVPDTINRPRQSPITSSRTSQSLLHHDTSLNESVRIHKELDPVGSVINSASLPNTQLNLDIQLGLNTSQQAQRAASEGHSGSYSDVLQDTVLQLPMPLDRRGGRSNIRVSDFRSLGVVPDCISDSLQIAPSTSSPTSKTLLQDDPTSYELSRLRREREQVVKAHEESNTRMRDDYLKEEEEIKRKYSKLHLDNDTAFSQKKIELHTNFKRILMNGRLAEAFRAKMM